MQERLSNHQTVLAVIIIGFVFIGIFFFMQFIVPLILWTRRKLVKVSYTGQEIIEILLNDEAYDKIKVLEKNRYFKSPYFSYNKYNKTLTFSSWTMEGFSLDTIFKIFTAFTFAEEKRNKIFSFSWQLWVLQFLSLIPYLSAIAMLLLIFLPDIETFNNISSLPYYLSAEALGILSFVVIIIIMIWWTYAVQSLDIQFDNYLKIINNKALQNIVKSHYKVCSYIPFSWRILI